MASSVAIVLDIENVLDLEGKNSDIYHVINCISHFFWIVYIDIMVDVVHSFIDFITISCKYNVDDKCRTILR